MLHQVGTRGESNTYEQGNVVAPLLRQRLPGHVLLPVGLRSTCDLPCNPPPDDLSLLPLSHTQVKPVQPQKLADEMVYQRIYTFIGGKSDGNKKMKELVSGRLHMMTHKTAGGVDMFATRVHEKYLASLCMYVD